MIIIKSDIVSLHGAAISKIGGRPENQDDMAYLDTPIGFLIVVCDGMGGGPGGKTASYIVKQEIAEVLLNCSPQTPRDHALKKAAARAHQALEEKMRENPALCGMGATFVAALINSQSAVIAHTGDSRLYRLHGKNCLFRTQDHSLVAELVKKKVMTEEDARQSPQANVITRGLGSTNNHVPEIDEIPFKKGDRFVLCTDGIWGTMQHPELIKLFTQPKDIQQLLTELSAQVDRIGFSKGGGHDNHTIAMFELEKDSLMKDKMIWKKIFVIISALTLILCLIIIGIWTILKWDEIKRDAGSQSNNSLYIDEPYQDNIPIFVAETKEPKETIPEENKRNTEEYDSLRNLIENSIELQSILKAAKQNKSRKESDNIKENRQQERDTAISPIETAQELINQYKASKNVSGATIKEAQSKIDNIREDIQMHINELCEQTKNNDSIYQIADTIRRVAKNNRSWFIDKTPDMLSKQYKPTRIALKTMDRQIERIQLIKRILNN